MSEETKPIEETVTEVPVLQFGAVEEKPRLKKQARKPEPEPEVTDSKAELKSLLASRPSLAQVKQNPWLYEEWAQQVGRLTE